MRGWVLVMVGLVGCSTLSGLDDYRVLPSGAGAGGAGAGDGGAAGEGGHAGQGGCDANLSVDAHHCGACGRDCVEGTCVMGECQPYPVIEGEVEVIGIALDATHIYWTTGMDGAVRRRPLAGGNIETLYMGWPVYIDVRGPRLYWSDYSTGEIWSSDLAGGDQVVLGNVTTASGIAADDGGVYVTELDSGGDILFLPSGGGMTTIVSSRDEPEEVALRGNTLYWTEAGGGALYSMDLPGGSPTLVVDGQAKPSGIALDDSHIYWGVYDADRVRRAPLSKTTDVEDFGVADDATGVTIVGDTVYWAESATGTIWARTK